MRYFFSTKCFSSFVHSKIIGSISPIFMDTGETVALHNSVSKTLTYVYRKEKQKEQWRNYRYYSIYGNYINSN